MLYDIIVCYVTWFDIILTLLKKIFSQLTKSSRLTDFLLCASGERRRGERGRSRGRGHLALAVALLPVGSQQHRQPDHAPRRHHGGRRSGGRGRRRLVLGPEGRGRWMCVSVGLGWWVMGVAECERGGAPLTVRLCLLASAAGHDHQPVPEERRAGAPEGDLPQRAGVLVCW